MPFYIEDDVIEMLLNDVVKITGETKAEAVHRALEERYKRLVLISDRKKDTDRLLKFLQEEVWPQIPSKIRKTNISKAEVETILGFEDESG